MSLVLARTRKVNWALVAILLLGLILRLWGINFGLPYTIAPDEPTHFKIALQFFQTGDLNPHWLNYPTLMFYLNAIALVPYYLVGKGLGVFSVPADIPPPIVVTMGVGALQVPSEFLYSRVLTALFGVASIGLVYILARQMRLPEWGSLVASFLFAISPADVYNSHLIRPDTFAVFFALVSMSFALRIVASDNPRNYIWAGACAGLAVSSKYNMPLIGIALVMAHFMRCGIDGWKHKELYLGIVASVAGLLLTSPFIVLDIPLFLRGFGFEVIAQGAGHAGWEGNTVQWYLTFLWSTEGVLVIAAIIQAARILFAKSKNAWVFLSFPIVYYIFINLFFVRNDRTILPVLPFLHILAAMFLVDVYAEVSRRSKQTIARSSALAACFLFSILPLATSIDSDIRFTEVDGRDTARAWLETNLPSGTRVAQEAYTPYLDTSRYNVYGIDSIVDQSPDWYVQNGFEYLILSQGMYGRFYDEPDRYSAWIVKYKELFSRFQQVARFDDNDYEIQVYQTDVKLPPHRVAARYGDYGEQVELVGYDDVKWQVGEPLRVRLSWRALGDKPEPLQVELRLLGANGQAIAKSQDDLFQGKGWRQGIFDGEWTIPVQANLDPGSYRLQVSVIWTRFAYQLPANDWAGQNLGDVFLAPIDLSGTNP